MRDIKKYIINILIIFLFFQTNMLAAETENVEVAISPAVSEFNEPRATTFSVTLPMTLPIDVASDGTVTTANDAKIINNSSSSVKVTNVEIKAENYWEIIDFNTDISGYKMNERKFGLRLNTLETNSTGFVFDETCFPTLASKNESNTDELVLDYNAVISPQTNSIINKEIAKVIFTVDWDNSSGAETEVALDYAYSSGTSNTQWKKLSDNTFYIAKSDSLGGTVLSAPTKQAKAWMTYEILTIGFSLSTSGTLSFEFDGLEQFFTIGAIIELNTTKLQRGVNNLSLEAGTYEIKVTCPPSEWRAIGGSGLTFPLADTLDKALYLKDLKIIEDNNSGETVPDASEVPYTVTSTYREYEGEWFTWRKYNTNTFYFVEHICGDDLKGTDVPVNGRASTEEPVIHKITNNNSFEKSTRACAPTAWDPLYGAYLYINFTLDSAAKVSFTFKGLATFNSSVDLDNKTIIEGYNEISLNAGTYQMKVRVEADSCVNSSPGHIKTLEQTAYIKDFKIVQDATAPNGIHMTTQEATAFGFSYTLLADGTYSLTGMPTTVENIEFPAYIDEKLVTKLGFTSGKGVTYDSRAGDAWSGVGDNPTLKSVIIPNSVKSIGNAAFYACTSLTSVTIPDSVIDIGDQAFYYCSSLTSITIPDSVIIIGSSAFKNYPDVTRVIYSGTAAGSPWGAKEHLLEMPTGIHMTIQEATAFGYRYTLLGDGTYSLTDMPDYVEHIEFPTTIDEKPVTELNFMHGGGTAYTKAPEPSTGEHNPNLRSVIIPDSVTYIGTHAFNTCTSLESVIFGNSVKTIRWNAFVGCTSLTSIIIPDTVIEIEEYTFSGCTNLTSVTIGNSVTAIGDYAFSSCTSLTSVTIGNSVTSIGKYAFYECSILTSVSIPKSVTTIGWNTFAYCTSLTSVIIPDSVTTIGNEAFNQVISITYTGSATGSPWGALSVNGTPKTLSLIETIALNTQSLTLAPNTTGQLVLSLPEQAPETATPLEVVWSTSDASIAIVDATGLVTGVSEGVATVTATVNEISVDCTVTIITQASSSDIPPLAPNTPEVPPTDITPPEIPPTDIPPLDPNAPEVPPTDIPPTEPVVPTPPIVPTPDLPTVPSTPDVSPVPPVDTTPPGPEPTPPKEPESPIEPTPTSPDTTTPIVPEEPSIPIPTL